MNIHSPHKNPNIGLAMIDRRFLSLAAQFGFLTVALLFGLVAGSAAEPLASKAGDGVERRDLCRDPSLDQCTHLANQGDVDAQVFLAEHYVSRYYMRGRHSFPEEDRLAFEWMSRAASHGHVRAQFSLGSFYHHGDFVSVDRDQAFVWYRRAAEQGDRNAEEALARLMGAVAQGRFENGLLLVCLLALFIFPALSLGDRSLTGYAGRFWFWVPHFTSLFVVAWWLSRGSWGGDKHPFLRSLLDGVAPEVAMNLIILVPFFSGLIYLVAFYSRPQDRGHFWVSLLLYVPVVVAAVIFGSFMAQLAKLG